jgi:hypothetical protein
VASGDDFREDFFVMAGDEFGVREVLCGLATSTNLQARLARLWQQADQLRWFSASPSRIIIQVGQAFRPALALDITASLAAFLVDRIPQCTIEILDTAARPDEWPGLARREVRAEDALRVAGVAAAEGLFVPRFWFESFALITVAAAHPDPRTRLAVALDAQADSLRRLRNGHPWRTLVYEAHRLAPSDLVIACGHARWNDLGSEAWWVVGREDFGVEQTVAPAAGVDVQQLPTLRVLARHEVLPPAPQLTGSLPELHGYLASEWQARLLAAGSQAASLRGAVVHDLRMARRNLGKVPHFVRRQLAARAKGRAA